MAEQFRVPKLNRQDIDVYRGIYLANWNTMREIGPQLYFDTTLRFLDAQGWDIVSPDLIRRERLVLDSSDQNEYISLLADVTREDGIPTAKLREKALRMLEAYKANPPTSK